LAIASFTVLASAIQLLTGYFTETNWRPVKEIGNSSEAGAATVILSVVSTGTGSGLYSALLTGAAVFGTYLQATRACRNATASGSSVRTAASALLPMQHPDDQASTAR
jgi:K(+)-stimulated pyrophosphate-energized sodium pump